jgi:hypothetical protein
MWPTLLAGLATLAALIAAVGVVIQGCLLRKQIQLQGLLELDKEWNSEAMVENRARAWTEAKEPDLGELEGVLEFLEKVGSLEEAGVLDAKLIWDLAVGWYLIRYSYYCRDAIKELRRRWTAPREDPTLYQDLEELSAKLLRFEVKRRSKRGPRVTEEMVCQELDARKKEFIESERSLSGNGQAHP